MALSHDKGVGLQIAETAYHTPAVDLHFGADNDPFMVDLNASLAQFHVSQICVRDLAARFGWCTTRVCFEAWLCGKFGAFLSPLQRS